MVLFLSNVLFPIIVSGMLPSLFCVLFASMFVEFEFFKYCTMLTCIYIYIVRSSVELNCCEFGQFIQ